MTRRIHVPTILVLTLISVGCQEDNSARLAQMAERHAQQQAEQNRRIAELHQHVAEERAAVGRQRDALEAERRELAKQRRLDPIIAEAVANAALIMACIFPLVLCWQLLLHRDDPADDALVAEAFLEDLVAEKPLLLPAPQKVVAIEYRGEATDDESKSPKPGDGSQVG